MSNKLDPRQNHPISMRMLDNKDEGVPVEDVSKIVLETTLTGLTSPSGKVTDKDSVLSGVGKLQKQIDDVDVGVISISGKKGIIPKLSYSDIDFGSVDLNDIQKNTSDITKLNSDVSQLTSDISVIESSIATIPKMVSAEGSLSEEGSNVEVPLSKVLVGISYTTGEVVEMYVKAKSTATVVDFTYFTQSSEQPVTSHKDGYSLPVGVSEIVDGRISRDSEELLNMVIREDGNLWKITGFVSGGGSRVTISATLIHS